MTTRLSNSDLFANSYISNQWGSGYKLELDLTSESVIEDWKLDFNLPQGSTIRNAYGVELTDNGNNSYSISGTGSREVVKPGQTDKVVFIIDTNNSEAIVPQFQLDAPTSNDSKITTDSEIVKDWKGGYKLEVDISSQDNANDWQLDFNLPQGRTIRDAYGVELTDNGSGSYSISGKGNLEDLQVGERAKAVFIINDSNQKAIVPQFTASTNNLMGATLGEPISAPAPAPQVDSTSSNSPAPATNDNNLMGSTISEPISAPAKLSSNAISVGFENHSSGTSYTNSAQSKDWDVDWSYQMDKYGTISNSESRSGDNSLQMMYPANAQSNAGAKWVVPNQKEYYLSYWVKFDNDFDFDGDKYSGGKLPGLGSGDLASGGNKPTGTNGFTSRYMWREGGQATLYLYHMDQPKTYGEDFLLKDSNGSQKYFERGQWHNMVQRVKVNDGSSSNGEVDVWMDGEQVLDLDNLRFMTNGGGIDTAYFSTFHGGNGSDWWPDKNDNAYFDDFVVSTEASDVGL